MFAASTLGQMRGKQTEGVTVRLCQYPSLSQFDQVVA
jgi:hypothetical protein